MDLEESFSVFERPAVLEDGSKSERIVEALRDKYVEEYSADHPTRKVVKPDAKAWLISIAFLRVSRSAM
jgi:hypothetical protein